MNRSLAIIFSLALLPHFAFAGPSNPSAGNAPQRLSGTSQLVAAPDVSAVREAMFSVTKDLEEVERLHGQQRYPESQSMALVVYNRLRLINPKVFLREVIEVSGVLHPSDVRQPFAALSNSKKNKIRQALADHRGGFYMETLLVAKRAKMYEAEATIKMVTAQTFARDKDRILKCYLSAHRIPILIQEKGQEDAMMIFDSDVANEDHQFWFNREILQSALRSKTLGLTENQFNEYLNRHAQSVLAEHQGGITQAPAPVVDAEPVRNEISNAFTSPNFKACWSLAYKQYSGDDASRMCRRLASFVDFLSADFTTCWDLAYRQLSGADAINSCVNQLYSNGQNRRR